SLALPALADFLAKAEEYHRTGVLPASATPKRGAGRTRTPKPAPITVPEAAQRVMALYERAADPELQYEAIETEIAALDKALSQKDMIALAGEVGINKPLKTKKAARDEIKRKITDRKGSFERTQFRPVAAAPDPVAGESGIRLHQP